MVIISARNYERRIENLKEEQDDKLCNNKKNAGNHKNRLRLDFFKDCVF